MHYNGWFTAITHGLMSLSLTQSWFPLHAEVWNAPPGALAGTLVVTRSLYVLQRGSSPRHLHSMDTLFGWNKGHGLIDLDMYIIP